MLYEATWKMEAPELEHVVAQTRSAIYAAAESLELWFWFCGLIVPKEPGTLLRARHQGKELLAKRGNWKPLDWQREQRLVI
jgi:hypothetical protein